MVDLIRDLGFTKSGVELLTSRLNEWNLLGDYCKRTAYRNRHLEFFVYFNVIEDPYYCKDKKGLISTVGKDPNPNQWLLFIDSSTKSLEAVILRNGNYIFINSSCLFVANESRPVILSLSGMFVVTPKCLDFFLGLQNGYSKYSRFFVLVEQ